jgi:hypothetical protein
MNKILRIINKLRRFRYFFLVFTLLGLSVIIPSEFIKGDISEAIAWCCVFLLAMQVTANDLTD